MSDDTTPPVKRGPGRPKGSKRGSELPAKAEKNLALAAASGDPKVITKTIAQLNQTPAPNNRNVSDAHMEVVLTRVGAGDPLPDVCRELGISAALVRKRCYDQPAWADRMAEARRLAADEKHERMLTVAMDATLPIADRRLIVEVLEKHAKVHHRAAYGDKVDVNHKQLVVQVTKDDLDLL